MKKYSIISTCILLLVAGCVTKQLTPEEAAIERERQIKMATRVYEGKTSKEILLAADRIFRLADDDYTLSHSETALQAQRPWMIYLVIAAAMGTDTWIVETSPLDNGTKVIARHAEQAQGISPTPTANFDGSMGATASSSPVMMGMTTTAGLYDLFFARLDYLLGLRKDWVTCKDAKDYDGPLQAFCVVANDRLPEGLAATQVRADTENNGINAVGMP